MHRWIGLLVTAGALLTLGGCQQGLLTYDDDTVADDDTGDDDDDDDTGDDDTEDDDATDDDDDTTEEFDYGTCGFEEGDLTGFGFPGEDWWVSDEGGIVAVKREGENFSGLLGDEDLEFPGSYAAVLRSNESGDPDTAGHLVTDPFVPEVPTLIVDQLSEVDDRGIYLEWAILDEYGDVLELEPMEVQTGGYVPSLAPGQPPLDGFPEITANSGQPGEFVRHVIDLTPYWEDEETIQVRFRQHTTLDGVGFFTLLDNVCNLDPQP